MQKPIEVSTYFKPSGLKPPEISEFKKSQSKKKPDGKRIKISNLDDNSGLSSYWVITLLQMKQKKTPKLIWPNKKFKNI